MTSSRPFLIIMVGLAGSGKSTVAQALAERTGATVISSDLVRKQLAGIVPTDSRVEEYRAGIYTADFTERTYRRLLDEGRQALRQGRSVILDATFINAVYRLAARGLAEGTGARFLVVLCEASEAVVTGRLGERAAGKQVSDARLQTYLEQKRHMDPLTDVDPGRLVRVDTGKPLETSVDEVLRRLQQP